MNFIIWLIVGGVIGWLASLVMKTDGQQGIILNVVVGIAGAVLGGWLISPMLARCRHHKPRQFQHACFICLVSRRSNSSGHRQSCTPRQRPLIQHLPIFTTLRILK